MVKVINKLILNNKIDSNKYVEFLIKYCYINKIINDEELNRILKTLLELLHYKCSHYNSGLVSTIKIDNLKNINDSNMFTLGLYLKKFNIYNGINILLNDEIISLYNKSYSNLIEYINKTKMFYRVVFLKNIVKTNNYYYNSTLNEGIKSFFKLYNSSYYSDRLIISVDYECVLKRPNLNGIEFINKYLEYINCENIYCKKFNYKNIELMLKKKYVRYEDIVINIFSDVFLVSLLLKYLNKDIYSLNIDLIDVNRIYNEFNNIEKFKNSFHSCFLNLKNEFDFNDEVNNYLDKYYFKIMRTIVSFVENYELEKLIGKCDSVII